MKNEIKDRSKLNIIVIKTKFKSAPSNIFGHLIIMLNNDKEFESYNAVVSTTSDVYNKELSTEWDKYEEHIADLKWKGKFNNNITASLMSHLSTLEHDLNTVGILFDFAYEYDYKNLEINLYDQINRILHEKNLVLETVIQEVPHDEYKKILENRGKPKEFDEKNKQDSIKQAPETNSSTIIAVDPVLAPVKGKPIYDLKVGDTIMIKIKPVSDQANYLIDDLKLREKNEIIPYPASVIDIKAGTERKDPIEILTKIVPGVFGKTYENETQVKLKIYDPEIDGEFNFNLKEKKPVDNIDNISFFDNEKSIFSKGTFIMLSIFMVILTLLIALILINW